MEKRANLGRFGESIACEYLVKKGYRIIRRNYREKFDEIDIIGKSKDGVLVFCEVKTFLGKRDSTSSLVPEDNLTSAKIKKITRVCLIFAGKHSNLIDPNIGWRIDLITVAMEPIRRIASVRHYENIGIDKAY